MKLIYDKQNHALQYVVADNIHSSEVCAIFSTRNGGVSGQTPETEHLSSLNLRFDMDDEQDIENVMKNYEIIASSQGFSAKDVVALWQNHTDRVIVITQELADKRPLYRLDVEADALITNVKGMLLSVRTADCVPILIYDEKTKSIGAAHSGWKGTFNQIGAKTITRMTEMYGTNPADLRIAIGPAAGICCYEVSTEFYEDFYKKYDSDIDKFFISEKGGKPHCNLKSMNKEFLIKAGVKESNIEVSDYCTICNPDLFYSYRRSGTKRGIMASLIGLK